MLLKDVNKNLNIINIRMISYRLRLALNTAEELRRKDKSKRENVVFIICGYVVIPLIELKYLSVISDHICRNVLGTRKALFSFNVLVQRWLEADRLLFGLQQDLQQNSSRRPPHRSTQKEESRYEGHLHCYKSLL